MGWFVWGVWLVWDLAAKTCGRSHTPKMQTLSVKAATRLESRGAMRAERCYRCSMCNTYWPPLIMFSRCLKCGNKCWLKAVQSGDDVLSMAEALKIKAYADFEKYCELRDDERAQEEIDRLASDLPLFPDAFVS